MTRPVDSARVQLRLCPGDCGPIAALFYRTVHAIGPQDYTARQLDAWAPGEVDEAQWHASFLQHDTLVAVDGDRIVGFGDMASDGYLDRLYVHPDYQRLGIATRICAALERRTQAAVFHTHASITARPFFEAIGYRTVCSQQVTRRGVNLTNYRMEKKPEV